PPPPLRRKCPHLADRIGAQCHFAAAGHPAPGPHAGVHIAALARAALWKRRRAPASAAMSRTALPAIGGIVQSLLTLPTSERTEAAPLPMLRGNCPAMFPATTRRGLCFSASVEHSPSAA